MSIADLLIGLLIPVYVLLKQQSISSGVCKSWLVLDYVACSASALCVVVISMDRYLLVSKELVYLGNQKTYKAVLINFGVWG